MNATNEPTSAAAGLRSSPSTCSVLTRLQNHIAQMAAHQKERHGGKLILEARTEIERLQGIIARNAMQRLDERDNAKMYVTVDDIKDSLEVLNEWRKRQAPNVGGQARESDERCPAPTGSYSEK